MNWPLVVVVALTPFAFAVAAFASFAAFVSLWYPHSRMERLVGAGYALVGASMVAAWVVALWMVGVVS